MVVELSKRTDSFLSLSLPIPDLRASWEEWWTYDGISGEFVFILLALVTTVQCPASHRAIISEELLKATRQSWTLNFGVAAF